MSPKVPQPESAPLQEASFRHSPIEALRNLFVGFCQGLFAAAPVGSYHWDPDDNITEIVIQDEASVKAEVLHKRPCITLTRGVMQGYSFGIDDLRQYDMDIGRKVKSQMIPGTMTINCCSRVSLEAENIAWVVFEMIWLLRDLLISSGLFDVARNNQLGAPTPAGSIIAADSGDEWVCVPVVVPFQFQRTSAFTPLGQTILNNVVYRMSSRLGPPLQHVGPPGGAIPLHLQVCPSAELTNAPDQYGRSPDFSGSRNYFLPKQHHPLDPSRVVTVQVVRPNHPGMRNAGQIRSVQPAFQQTVGVPFSDPCVEES